MKSNTARLKISGFSQYPECPASGRTNLAQLRRQGIKLRRPQPAMESQVVFVLHSTNTVRDNQTSQLLGKRQRIVICDEAAARGAGKMKAFDAEILHQIVEVVRRC